MDRRHFIGRFAAPAAIAWLVTQRAQGQEATTPAYPNAVPVASDVAATGLDPATVNALFTINPAYTPNDQATTYPQSVAAGDPSPNGVVLWTRVDPAATQLNGTDIAAEIAADSAFTAPILQATSSVNAAADNTVKLPISNSALQPFQIYYYRFIFAGIPSRTGRFKTLPPAGYPLEELRLGYVVCQDYGNGFYTALRYLAQENVDYVVHLGDYIYETITSNFQGNPARIVPGFPSGSTTVPVNVDDYRHLYRVYRGDADLQAMHEQFACIQLWDDHEFANDCHGEFHPDNNTAPTTADTPQPDLRYAANQAWSDYSLADITFNASGDWETSVRLYRKLSFGALADLIITDERLYRDGPPCGNGEAFQRYFSVGCSALHNANRTMLGADQKQWFVQQVTTSGATWKLWANEVMLMQLKAAGLIYVDLDQWDGYPKERQALLGTIKSANVNNFVALTGDLHTFLAGYLKSNFDNIFESPMGIELMVGSVTSANLAEDIESAVDLPSSPMPAKSFGVPPNLLEPLIRLNNPHIQYWDSSTHGYGILDITPSELVCTFKAVTNIRSEDASLVTLRTFTIPSGTVKLIQS
jgi:alkaline phosphatase D